MTKPISLYRAGRIAVLVAAAALLLAASPIHAASSIEVEARALVGGRYEVGGWMALSVTLVNEGEPTDGYVTAETPAGAVRRYVEMPAGARKVVMLYVQPEAFQRTIEVAYQEPNGTVRVPVDVRVLEQSNDQVATVGDGAGTLRPQLLGSDGVTRPEPITLAPADIPERPEPLAGLSAIVWAGDSTALSEAQRRSVERWVAEGGQLIVVGGADWQARTAAFADLLPLEELAAVDAVPQATLAAWTGSDEPATPDATVSTGVLRDDARPLITAEDGSVLASMRSVGAGRVILIGPDLATDAHRAWEGGPRLWGRLLPTNALLDQFMGGGFPIQEEINNALGQALNTLPSLEVPPAELLLAVIVGYILLIGPISYVVLRRLDRRELAWVTAPLLVVLFSASSFGIGRSMKGSDVIVNQITVVRSTSDSSTASVESYAGIYSPERASYDVSVEADALMGLLAANNGQELGGNNRRSDVVVEQGDPAHLRGLAIGVFGFEAVRAVGIVEHEPSLSVTWSSRDGEQVGTVTNDGEGPISDVAWISPSGGEMIGDLAPGESVSFVVPSVNFNGSTASDQVYGFGGLDSTSDEQRQVQMRRQVIDALVGYGAFGPGRSDFGAGGRGPYVIGWHSAAGPLPVVFDGQDAQRYDTMVEVIAARPALGSGEVVVRPHDMAIDVLETAGDATPAGPGTTMLGDGSVTYGLALPLEAAAMAVSDVDIVVGSDPMTVASDPGAFGGAFPDGYLIEILDPGTGEWVVLGDLSDSTRFEVDDPASVISATGRIEVRVTGELDPNFGQPTIFVSAQVTGVIAE